MKLFLVLNKKLQRDKNDWLTTTSSGYFYYENFQQSKSKPGTQPEKCHFDISVLIFYKLIKIMY